MKRHYPQKLMLATLVGAAGLMSTVALAQDTDVATPASASYVAHFSALNDNITGSTASGDAQLQVKGDNLLITMHVAGVSPDTTHWQHFHGFKDGHTATCATQAADANGDGIVDLMETEKASGTTMVPFDNAPAAMDVAHGTYPKASADGTYTYTQTVPLKDLQAAFGEAFDGQKLQLDHRVIYIHGVPDTTKLPASVASLGPIPASVTLPVACAKIEPAR